MFAIVSPEAVHKAKTVTINLYFYSDLVSVNLLIILMPKT